MTVGRYIRIPEPLATPRSIRRPPTPRCSPKSRSPPCWLGEAAGRPDRGEGAAGADRVPRCRCPGRLHPGQEAGGGRRAVGAGAPRRRRPTRNRPPSHGSRLRRHASERHSAGPPWWPWARRARTSRTPNSCCPCRTTRTTRHSPRPPRPSRPGGRNSSAPRARLPQPRPAALRPARRRRAGTAPAKPGAAGLEMARRRGYVTSD